MSISFSYYQTYFDRDHLNCSFLGFKHDFTCLTCKDIIRQENIMVGQIDLFCHDCELLYSIYIVGEGEIRTVESRSLKTGFISNISLPKDLFCSYSHICHHKLREISELPCLICLRNSIKPNKDCFLDINGDK